MSLEKRELEVSSTVQLPTCYSELPKEVMLNVYRCLPLEDLINIRDVHETWKEFTNSSYVWKHAPLKICNHEQFQSLSRSFLSREVAGSYTHSESILTRLSRAPYLHTVKGYYDDVDLIVNAMLNNLKDLREMNVEFTPPITSEKIAELVKKFPNLESFTVDLKAPDCIDSLAVLQNCSKLKEIKFSQFPKPILEEWKTQFLDMMCNFKILNILDLKPFSESQIHCSDILNLLGCKIKQLTFLKLQVDEDTSDEFFEDYSTVVSNIISGGEYLQELHLLIYNELAYLPDHIVLNFAQMNNLKVLHLSLPPGTWSSTLTQMTFPSSLQVLNLQFYRVPHAARLLECAIKSCPDLKYFQAWDLNDKDLNEQLENLSMLSNFNTLILEECQYLTTRGYENISKCKTLRCLKLIETPIDDVSFNHLKSCKYLQELVLRRCDLDPNNLLPTVLALKYLTRLHVSCCYQSNAPHNRLSNDFFENMIRECRANNHIVNISWSFSLD